MQKSTFVRPHQIFRQVQLTKEKQEEQAFKLQRLKHDYEQLRKAQIRYTSDIRTLEDTNKTIKRQAAQFENQWRVAAETAQRLQKEVNDFKQRCVELTNEKQELLIR